MIRCDPHGYSPEPSPDEQEDTGTLPIRPRPTRTPPPKCGRCGTVSHVLGWCHRCQETTAR